MKVAIVFACLLAAASALTLKNFKDCAAAGSDGAGTILEIKSDQCTTDPCKLKRGMNVTMSVKFVPKFASNKIEGVVHGVILGIPAPFPLPSPDGCKSVGCPTEPGVEYTYSESLFVENWYPKLSLTVKWELVDKEKSDKNVWCFTMPASIVD